MRRINIIHAGNVKEDYFKQALREYTKRLSADFIIEHTEIKEDRGLNLEKEADKIFEKLKKLEKSDKAVFKIVLDREGTQLSSEKFAGLLYSGRAIHAQCTVFIIGSSHGLSGRVKESADFRLSFSDMTFPHSLFRVMLMEQIYRAYMIDRGRAYHK